MSFLEKVTRCCFFKFCKRCLQMVMENNFIFNNICVTSIFHRYFCFGFNIYIFNFSGTYTIIQAYRNKCGIIEYWIAGATSGLLYKFNLGPRGWVVGAGLGKLSLDYIKTLQCINCFYR